MCNTPYVIKTPKGGEKVAKFRGRPIITLRLAPETIAALKICANQHGKSVSDLLRDLIDEQLSRDGISTAQKPIEGQISI